MTPERKALAETLRRMRRLSGMSQVDVAALAGISRNAVASYEAGHSTPTFLRFAAIAEANGYALDMACRIYERERGDS